MDKDGSCRGVTALCMEDGTVHRFQVRGHAPHNVAGCRLLIARCGRAQLPGQGGRSSALLGVGRGGARCCWRRRVRGRRRTTPSWLRAATGAPTSAPPRRTRARATATPWPRAPASRCRCGLGTLRNCPRVLRLSLPQGSSTASQWLWCCPRDEMLSCAGPGVRPVPPHGHLRRRLPHHRGVARRGRHPAQQRGRALHGEVRSLRAESPLPASLRSSAGGPAVRRSAEPSRRLHERPLRSMWTWRSRCLCAWWCWCACGAGTRPRPRTLRRATWCRAP